MSGHTHLEAPKHLQMPVQGLPNLLEGNVTWQQQQQHH
jgi:hypothetical protein